MRAPGSADCNCLPFLAGEGTWFLCFAPKSTLWPSFDAFRANSQRPTFWGFCFWFCSCCCVTVFGTGWSTLPPFLPPASSLLCWVFGNPAFALLPRPFGKCLSRTSSSTCLTSPVQWKNVSLYRRTLNCDAKKFITSTLLPQRSYEETC